MLVSRGARSHCSAQLHMNLSQIIDIVITLQTETYHNNDYELILCIKSRGFFNEMTIKIVLIGLFFL